MAYFYGLGLGFLKKSALLVKALAEKWLFYAYFFF